MNTLINTLIVKKEQISFLMSFVHDKSLESTSHEVASWLCEYEHYKSKYQHYSAHIDRAIKNNTTNKASRFKDLGKTRKVDFSSLPPCEEDWSDIPE